MFTVTDANGAIKAAIGGALTDPLTVPHGGIMDVNQILQSEMIYGLTTNHYARLLVDNDLGATPWKTMFNGGSVLSDGTILADNGPRWGKLFGSGLDSGGSPFIGRVSSFKSKRPRVWWSISRIGVGSGFANVGWTTSIGGTQSKVTDSTSTWDRFTTGAADNINVAGFNSPTAQPDWPAHLPNLTALIRTGSDITDTRLFIGFTSANLSGNTDDQSLKRVVGVRYSTAAGDSSWTPITCDGNGVQLLGSAIGSIAASTVYTITVNVGPFIASIYVNGVLGSVPVQPLIIGQGIGSQVGVKSVVTIATKFLDISAVYTDCQIPL